jgi:hypothetical protein
MPLNSLGNSELSSTARRLLFLRFQRINGAGEAPREQGARMAARAMAASRNGEEPPKGEKKRAAGFASS